MNNKDLWNAMGDIGTDIVLEAESAPKRSHKKHTAIILAAAMLVLFSVTAVATGFFTSFDKFFFNYQTEGYETPINKSAFSEETGIRFTAVSAMADERVCMVLWQIDNESGKFIDFPDYANPVNGVHENIIATANGNGYSHSMIIMKKEIPENTLTGYHTVEIDESQETVSGNITLRSIGWLKPSGSETGEETHHLESFIDPNLSINFTFEHRIESIVLKAKDSNIEIECSPISMSIKGGLPEFKELELVLADGSRVYTETKLQNCYLFTSQFDPAEIVSVLYNGEELLG